MGRKIFDVENKFWMFLNKMTDLFVLWVLAFLLSIPIVTMGAALTGFYYGAMRLFEGTDTGVWRDFFTGFKKSFKTATVVWLFQLLITVWILLNIYVCFKKIGTTGSLFFMIVNIVLLVMVFLISTFTYPVVARYKFGLKKVIHDSVLISFSHLPHALSLLTLMVIGCAVSLRIEYVGYFAPPIIGYQVARVSVWIFGKYEAHNQEEGRIEIGKIGEEMDA